MIYMLICVSTFSLCLTSTMFVSLVQILKWILQHELIWLGP